MNIKGRAIKEYRIKHISVWLTMTLTALLFLLGILYLDRLGLITIPKAIGQYIGSILLVIGVLFFVSLILRLTIKKVFSLFDEPEERIFYSKFYTWGLYTVGILIIVHHFGVSLGNITLLIGLMATGLAFAIRDVLLSFFGWMILLRKKPFRIGEYIRIGEDEGKVIHIGTFYVALDKTNEAPDTYAKVPNRLFLEKGINKLGKETFQEQIVFQLSAIPDRIKEIEGEIIKEISSLLEQNEFIKAFVDMRRERLCLVVEYPVNIKNRQMYRSHVIALIFSKVGNVIDLPKT